MATHPVVSWAASRMRKLCDHFHPTSVDPEALLLWKRLNWTGIPPRPVHPTMGTVVSLLPLEVFTPPAEPSHGKAEPPAAVAGTAPMIPDISESVSGRTFPGS